MALSSAVSSSATSTPVLLVGVDFGLPHFDAELEELGLLAQTAGMQPVARITCKRKAQSLRKTSKPSFKHTKRSKANA